MKGNAPAVGSSTCWRKLRKGLGLTPSIFAKAAGHELRVLDSHTAGEPTRLVLSGLPDLGDGDARQRQQRMAHGFDEVRSLLVREPWGHPATVGVVIGAPVDPAALLQAIYFNNAGYLDMCVHATIGLVHTLARVADLARGRYPIETPAGTIHAMLEVDGSVSIENVPSYRTAHAVTVPTEHHGTVTGDVAYGGNWFFLTADPMDCICPRELDRLRSFASDVRRCLRRDGITGHTVDGRGELEIDHIYVTGRASSSQLSQRNYVLCPGGTHDRSPCGTGTSANLACLAADGRLSAGELWLQESCIGTCFSASYRPARHPSAPGGSVVATINGRAYLTGETRVMLEADDPLTRRIA